MTSDLGELHRQACACRACPLWEPATQTVFGEGPVTAPVALVGEQPGDREDLAGRPFVGPAGRVLDEAMSEAGLERSDVYLTNAVKHFKFEPRGKRRIHQKPNAAEITACHPWLDAELAIVRPAVIGVLGVVAARSLLGRSVTISSMRDRTLEVAGASAIVTIHPSAVLRGQERRVELYDQLVHDLRRVGALVGER